MPARLVILAVILLATALSLAGFLQGAERPGPSPRKSPPPGLPRKSPAERVRLMLGDATGYYVAADAGLVDATDAELDRAGRIICGAGRILEPIDPGEFLILIDDLARVFHIKRRANAVLVFRAFRLTYCPDLEFESA